MELRVWQPIKTVTVVALLAYAPATFQRADDYEFTIPLKPAFGSIASTAGTAVVKGERGHHSRPPDAQVEPKVRRYFGGAIPDP